MTARELVVNRWTAEQALLTARRYGSRFDLQRTKKILAALDKHKGVAKFKRLEVGDGVEGPI